MVQDWAFVVNVEETNEVESRLHVIILHSFSLALHFTNDSKLLLRSDVLYGTCSQLNFVHLLLPYPVCLSEFLRELSFSKHFKHHISQNLDEQTKS